MRALVPAALLALCVALSGCADQPPQAPAPGPQTAAEASTVAPDTGAPYAPLTLGARAPRAGLAVVHDTGKVTGSYPAHCRTTADDRPDPTCSPGSVRDDVNDATMAQTICRPGWTATVRADTGRSKAEAMAVYGIPASARATVEDDHVVPLELGGSNATTNLWPEVSDQPGKGFRNSKDNVENKLNDAVCAHRVPLDQAQSAIADNWHTALSRFGLR